MTQDREILRLQSGAVDPRQRRADGPVSLAILQCQEGGAGSIIQAFTEMEQQARGAIENPLELRPFGRLDIRNMGCSLRKPALGRVLDNPHRAAVIGVQMVALQ